MGMCYPAKTLLEFQGTADQQRNVVGHLGEHCSASAARKSKISKKRRRSSLSSQLKEMGEAAVRATQSSRLSNAGEQ